MDNINSVNYWNDRFASGSWDQYDGEMQSVVFARIALSAFPDWFAEALRVNAWEVRDYGCAKGGGTAYIAQRFPSCRFVGVDFAAAAVESARERYPFCDFEVGDVTGEVPQTDVVFSSNTLEHLRQPMRIMTSLVRSARQYAVFILPFEDSMGIEEHFNIFEAGFFPDAIDGYTLEHFQVIDCRDQAEIRPYWNGKQILLIYAHPDADKAPGHALGRAYTHNIQTFMEGRHQAIQQLEQESAKVAQLSGENARLTEELASANRLLEERAKSIEDASQHIRRQQSDAEALRRQYEKSAASLDQCRAQMQRSLDQCSAQMQRGQQLLGQLGEQANDMMNWVGMTGKSAPMRLAHLVTQLKHGLFGSKQDRQEFRRWIRGDRSFVPTRSYVRQIGVRGEKIQAMTALISQQLTGAAALPVTALPDGSTVSTQPLSSSFIEHDDFLNVPYQKYDVIVFGIIDYTFRYQRPQQIADHFAGSGHRVFYVNANMGFGDSLEITRKGNLSIVTLGSDHIRAIYGLKRNSDVCALSRQLDQLMIREGIRDALMIVDYPTWYRPVAYLKERYGFSLITDYMDDFTGFVTTSEPFVAKDCKSLLRLSEAVAASSQFLLDLAHQYNDNVFAIRNGTEFKHFNQAYKPKSTNKRPVIGYYGAIAEWFDSDKIEYLAKEFPECDIVLIGAVTNEKVKTFQYPNVKLLGEKPYAELPGYLKDFDVCLIPFDTSTDLIKATNPVKFYEYLSAGKKIVATQIPELEPFEGRYVYLANDNKKFADDVRLCLEHKDTLAPAEECFAFAEENDWKNRVKAFEKASTGLFPKISIVVLCYNQLDYTRQCVDSILSQTAYPNYEIVLVDNCSTDDTAAYLQQLAKDEPRVKIVLNKTNRGFAGGNNDGINVSDGEYIVLLNNDTLVTRGWLTNMVKYFRQRERIGIVGAVTNSIGNEACIPVNYDSVADMPAFAYRYTADHMGKTYPHDGVLAMFCVMFSRELVKEIGLLDENYGIGMFEDDDYSFAAMNAGYDLILPEDVFIHHFGSVSFKKMEDEKHRKLFEKNKAYFEEKWKTQWQIHHYRGNRSN